MRSVYCNLAECVETFWALRGYCDILRSRYSSEHENKTRFAIVYSYLNPDQLRFHCHDCFFLQLDISLISPSYFPNC